jgi:hypothetical protein
MLQLGLDGKRKKFAKGSGMKGQADPERVPGHELISLRGSNSYL